MPIHCERASSFQSRAANIVATKHYLADRLRLALKQSARHMTVTANHRAVLEMWFAETLPISVVEAADNFNSDKIGPKSFPVILRLVWGLGEAK
jgi:hypothetical protein